jgi:molecular chaperone DnaK
VPQIEVTFDIDANGIVHVSAKDKATNKEQKIQIQASGGLSDDEVEKMVKEAEANAEKDKERRKLVDAQNQAEAMIHNTEKQLKEHGDKISAEDKKGIEEAIAALKEVKESDKVDEIEQRTQSLTQAAMKLGEALYKEAQEQQAKEGDTSKAKKEDDVVDADFKEVKEDDKKDGTQDKK